MLSSADWEMTWIFYESSCDIWGKTTSAVRAHHRWEGVPHRRPHPGRSGSDRGRLREDMVGAEPDAFGEAVPGDGHGVPAPVVVGGRSGQEGGGDLGEGGAGVDAVGTGR